METPSSTQISSSEPSATENPHPPSHDPYSNPLFLHPADSSSLTLVSEKLLGEQNFNLWSRAVIKALTTKNKLGFLYGHVPKPAADHADSGAWSRCNALVATWLTNSVSPDIASLILFLDDTQIIWETLETRFKQSNVSKIFNVEQRIDSLRQGPLDLNSFFTKLHGLWEELKNYEPYPLCSCGGCSCQANAKLIEIIERRNVVKFLMKLNDSYTQARRHILMLDPLPSLTKVYNLLSQEEHHHHSIPHPSEPVAFQATSFSFKPKPSFPRSTITKPRPQCTHCGLLGHTINRCYKLHGYPQSSRSSPSSFFPSPNTKPPLLPTPKYTPSVNLVTKPPATSASSLTPVSDPLAQAQVLFDQFQSQLKQLGASPSDSALTVPSTTTNPSSSSGPYAGLDDWEG
ncbi:PREDICTED: uncharacterized protein LOC104816398 [Tarenaya hassleriana]|uniref:uncharacterized protein LOC104816398 n=1 Tax=Tarenaya hassleriana TaxID=28532 RepID=UPI00053C8D73|nr:PREDICTED: uncharacterized protein LOC104816398 [Tarenaya hassleriana]